jgi:type VI secretion system protein ImpC
MLNASRFAHYIKAIMRDKIGSFMSRQEVSLFLNSWVAQYVLLSDVAPESVKASFPLREARIDVAEVPGDPGSYTAVIFLRPFFQLEELKASIRLVATLPRPGGTI